MLELTHVSWQSKSRGDSYALQKRVHWRVRRRVFPGLVWQRGNAAAGDDAVDPAGHDSQYLVVQRRFEEDDGGVCYIETHDHDTYTGHFRLRLLEFTRTRLALEIARTDHKYVEVIYHLDAKRFSDVQRIVHIIFGVHD